MNTVNSSEIRLEERRRAREERILEAAAAIVASEGIEALSLHKLARELGYVPAALYRYFESKDALIAALQRRAITLLHAEFRLASERAEREAGKRPLGPKARALHAIVAAARFYLALPNAAPEHFRLVSALLADPRPLVSDGQAERTAPLLLAFLADVKALIDRAVSVEALREHDSLDRTLVLWSSLQGITQLGKLTRFDAKQFDVVRLGERAVTDLLVGWGAPVAAITEAIHEQKRSNT